MKRLLTAAVLVPIIVYVVLFANQWVFFAVLAAVALLCLKEYEGIAGAHGIESFGPLAYGFGLALLFLRSEVWILLPAAALVTLALTMRGDLAKSLPRASAAVFGVAYIFGAWKCAIPLREANPHWLMYALMLNWAGDAGAYYVGRAFGKHRLAPRVSPKKTWEGAAASVVVAVLIAGGYIVYFAHVGIAAAIALTAAANIAGQIGDLAESAMKRGAGVKDSGALLPGHGGMLDRVDSTLFALPVVYAYVVWTYVSFVG
jgi:phosphatidate cytidylyltransferase